MLWNFTATGTRDEVLAQLKDFSPEATSSNSARYQHDQALLLDHVGAAKSRIASKLSNVRQESPEVNVTARGSISDDQEILQFTVHAQPVPQKPVTIKPRRIGPQAATK